MCAKVLIIGIDGGSWNHIEPILDELPAIKKLVRSGCYGKLRSTIPPITIPAWVSMFTGKNPGKLGVVGFTEKVGGTHCFNLVNSSVYRKNGSLWDLVARSGIKTLILNIPFTYPPYETSGHMISFDFAPQLETSPAIIKKELLGICGLDRDKHTHFSEKVSKEEKLEVIYKEEETILNIALYLLDKYDYDLVVIRFGIPDHVSHVTTREDKILECYTRLDTYLDKIIDKFDYDYVFLVSDHGLEKVSKRLALNTWLIKNGLLKLNTFGKLYLAISNILFRFGIDNIMKIISYFKKLIPGSAISAVSNFNFDAPGNRLLFRCVDLHNSVSYMYQSISLKTGCIYLLDDSSVDRVVQTLRNFRDKSGNFVFTNILRKTEVYSGDKLERLPDIIVFSNDYCIVPAIHPDVFFEREIFTHFDYGIFVCSGKSIRKGVKINCVTIYDIAPTVLHILGLPIPSDMDGRVLVEIFEDNSKIARRAPVYVNPDFYSRKDEKKTVKSKIRKLRAKYKF